MATRCPSNHSVNSHKTGGKKRLKTHGSRHGGHYHEHARFDLEIAKIQLEDKDQVKTISPVYFFFHKLIFTTSFPAPFPVFPDDAEK